MPEILSIGSVSKVDDNGFLINESHINKIFSPWKEAVEEIKFSYLKHLDRSLIHSIYVRGTVSRGMALEGISDIDTFTIIFEKPEQIDSTWMSEEREILEKKYSFASGVDMYCVSYDELLNNHHFAFADQFIIKTLSTCIFGQDLAEKISPFKPNIETARYLCVNLDSAIKTAKKNIFGNPYEIYIKEWCRWIMKIFLRSGFLLVMDKEKTFTRDLYPAYKLFSKYFPKQAAKMEVALNWAINPIQDSSKLINFLDEFGRWLEKRMRDKFC